MDTAAQREAEPYHRHVDLVFQGGGVKGIALVGAYSVLEEQGFLHQRLAGTSAGAIVAALLAAGYRATELQEILLSLDFGAFKDPSWASQLPWMHNAIGLLRDQGIYQGQVFLRWIRELLEAKGVRTFADLICPDQPDDPRYRYKLRVIASDITGRCMLALPQDATKLGVNPDDLNVALAVRMSMSIPFFFEPVRFVNHQTGEEHLVVDGGILSNFPVWLFDRAGVPRWPTFGLRLIDPEPRVPLAERLPTPEPHRGRLASDFDYLMSLVHTMLEAHDRMYIERADYARTIAIPTLGVHATQFDLLRDRALELHDVGRVAAHRFLETWDFEAYVAEFRRQRLPGE